ncbi:hypothetical protein [Falsiroseomonas sp. E2-1-a4]|uniref:hypothetical protein n=1 Tax=Falsiroseomonas sp. E2-1-a4 TaxID=3239299 RepID=UPI003F38AA52
MNFITPPNDEPDTWLGRTHGLRTTDAARFHGLVRIRMQEGLVFAQHHDSEFRALDWECIYRDANGRTTSRYKRGAQKGIVFTPPRGTTRLVVTQGVLSALAAAALLPAEDRTTCVAAIGGAWNPEAAACVVALHFRTMANVVEFAFDTHAPTLREMRDRAVHYLNAGGVDAEALEAPPGGWLAALRDMRLGGESRA